MTSVDLTAVMDRVEETAAGYNPRRVLLTLIAVPFVVLGFVVGNVARVVWTGVAWAMAASVVGYDVARGPGRREGRWDFSTG